MEVKEQVNVRNSKESGMDLRLGNAEIKKPKKTEEPEVNTTDANNAFCKDLMQQMSSEERMVEKSDKDFDM